MLDLDKDKIARKFKDLHKSMMEKEGKNGPKKTVFEKLK
jgi:hypothetical protein